MMRHFATGLAVALAVFTLLTATRPGLFQASGASPHPDLQPRQVVAIQLDALRRRHQPEDGFAVAYRFASALNQMHTGPLRRFRAMLKSEDYAILLDHMSIEFGPTLDLDSRSFVPVVVTNDAGVSSAYIWVLSRSRANPCGDCWMTDAVIPAGSLDLIRFA